MQVSAFRAATGLTRWRCVRGPPIVWDVLARNWHRQHLDQTGAVSWRGPEVWPRRRPVARKALKRRLIRRWAPGVGVRSGANQWAGARAAIRRDRPSLRRRRRCVVDRYASRGDGDFESGDRCARSTPAHSRARAHLGARLNIRLCSYRNRDQVSAKYANDRSTYSMTTAPESLGNAMLRPSMGVIGRSGAAQG